MRDNDLLEMINAWIASARYEHRVFAAELARTPRWRVRRRSTLRAKMERKRVQERRVSDRFLTGRLGSSQPAEAGLGRRARR